MTRHSVKLALMMLVVIIAFTMQETLVTLLDALRAADSAVLVNLTLHLFLVGIPLVFLGVFAWNTVRSEVSLRSAGEHEEYAVLSTLAPVKDRLDERARHEAAHAVAVLALGGEVKRATLRQSPQNGGYVEYEIPGMNKPELAFKRMIVGLAGLEAELRDGEYTAALSDVNMVQLNALVIVALGELPPGLPTTTALTQEELIHAARYRCQRILEANERALNQVAEALRADPTRLVPGEELSGIDVVMPQLIDA